MSVTAVMSTTTKENRNLLAEGGRSFPQSFNNQGESNPYRISRICSDSGSCSILLRCKISILQSNYREAQPRRTELLLLIPEWNGGMSWIRFGYFIRSILRCCWFLIKITTNENRSRIPEADSDFRDWRRCRSAVDCCSKNPLDSCIATTESL